MLEILKLPHFLIRPSSLSYTSFSVILQSTYNTLDRSFFYLKTSSKYPQIQEPHIKSFTESEKQDSLRHIFKSLTSVYEVQAHIF